MEIKSGAQWKPDAAANLTKGRRVAEKGQRHRSGGIAQGVVQAPAAGADDLSRVARAVWAAAASFW
jgi:hypothetical protein